MARFNSGLASCSINRVITCPIELTDSWTRTMYSKAHIECKASSTIRIVGIGCKFIENWTIGTAKIYTYTIVSIVNHMIGNPFACSIGIVPTGKFSKGIG